MVWQPGAANSEAQPLPPAGQLSNLDAAIEQEEGDSESTPEMQDEDKGLRHETERLASLELDAEHSSSPEV